MRKNKILLYIMMLVSIVLCIPSIIYLITNMTVDGFDSYFSYTRLVSNDLTIRCIEGVTFIGLILVFSMIYFMIVKYEKQIFKNKKQIFLFILIISFMFMMILPIFSSDIFYYLGDSWLSAKYRENPYYTTVKDLQDNGINDEILNNTGVWRATTNVYGPIMNMITTVLISFSFGNVTAALFIFKLASYLIHILNSYLIYKITKSIKCMLLYSLNPLVLLQLLSDVHNDIYLILFLLLALYFLVRKKNIYLTIIFLGLSVATKYSYIIIVPFILLYYFRNKTIPKRIMYCTISGIVIMAISIICYLPYYRDITIFSNMLVQNERFCQSIMQIINIFCERKTFNFINNMRLPLFSIIYLVTLICVLFFKKIKLRHIFNACSIMMLIFIFGVVTNFHIWYITWLFPLIFFTGKSIRKFTLITTIVSIIPAFLYFVIQSNEALYGSGYTLLVLMISSIVYIKQEYRNINVKEY